MSWRKTTLFMAIVGFYLISAPCLSVDPVKAGDWGYPKPKTPPKRGIRQPGVYIEETTGSKPVAGVSTSNAAFIGIADKGTVGKAVLITDWQQYLNMFGGLQSDGYLGYAVYSFFQEGGTRCYVVRASNRAGLSLGLRALDGITDVNIITIPDWAGDRSAITTTLNYCQQRKDCFFIADPPAGSSPGDIMRFKSDYAFNTSYGALYYPWIKVAPPSGPQRLIPPSGAVAGRYASTDHIYGVHKASAGTTNGRLRVATRVETDLRDGDVSQLASAGINPIRSIPGGLCIWGAHTMSQGQEWKYVNIRRLQIYIEQSIQDGLSWAAFETSDPTLWARVKQSIDPFLNRLWRSGALMGNHQNHAYFIKVDAENNPPSLRSQGKLMVTVGFAPVKPAEFIVMDIII